MQESSSDEVIRAAHKIMNAAHHCALVTIGADGQPQARMMDPFPPEPGLIVWMATNPATRKALEIDRDARVTLVYFDPEDPGYVTLLGTARLVDDPAERRVRWKAEWEDYYPGGPGGDDYTLIEFAPTRLEVVSLRQRIADDPLAWKPAIVELPLR